MCYNYHYYYYKVYNPAHCYLTILISKIRNHLTVKKVGNAATLAQIRRVCFVTITYNSYRRFERLSR